MTASFVSASDLDLIKGAKAGCRRSSDQLVLKYERLIHKFAHKYSWMAPRHSYEDLVQEGRIAVYGAMQKFEPERGLQFFTLVFHHVRGAVQSLARKENRHPKFTSSYESLKRSKKLEDPSQTYEIRMDLPEGKLYEVIVKVCGDIHSKRAQIICDKFGLFGHTELRTCEIADKYDLSKQAVHSYVVKFMAKARKLYPELEAFV